MDLISAHRQGLADQLLEEAPGLSGRARDGVQRAIVLHHLFDHSGGRHAYALLAASGALAIEPGLEAMRRAARRAWWRARGRRRAALLERIERFAACVRDIDRARCEAMWIAYRAAQHGATSSLVPTDLAGLGGGEDGRALFLAHQGWAEAQWGMELEAALVALDWPLGAAPVRRIVEALRIPLTALQPRGGLRKVERAVLADPRLPTGFAANPAQHYYALQRSMAAKRRHEQAALDGIPVEETVRLAAAA